jgi:hypothetical protein
MIGETLVACEDVNWIELAQDRFTGVPVISAINLRVVKQHGIPSLCWRILFVCV